MCLLGIAFRQFGDAPLLILANREEEWDRPSTGPAIMPRQVGFPAWVGGTDRLAGGTWLGVNEHGLVVAVTNRPKQSLPPEPPSRGLLCRSLLRFANVPAASEHAWQELRSGQFAGCNLILVSRDQGVVIHAGDELGRVALSPGLNLITNGDLEDPRDRRIARVRAEFSGRNKSSADDWIVAAMRIGGLPAGPGLPAVCLEFANRGTVSSTILGLDDEPALARYFFAPGPPSRTPYDDHSPLLRQILLPGQSTASDYRILLRGPWRFEPISSAQNADNDPAQPNSPLPAAGSCQMPASWQELFGSFRGRVRFRRTFHRPTNVDRHERVLLVFDEVAGSGSVSLNGRCLGALGDSAPTNEFDVTAHLSESNTLDVEFEFVSPPTDSRPGGLHGTVALVIRKQVGIHASACPAAR